MPFLVIKAPFSLTGDEVVFDGSHPTYFRLANISGSFELLLKKRAAYPTTTCRQTGKNIFQLSYGNPDGDIETEFLDIRAEANGDLYIKRDAVCTLPLFYTCTDQGLYISDDYADILSALGSVTVSKDAIHYQLTEFRYSSHTSVKEVNLLCERETLVWRRGQLHIIQPESRNWVESAAAPPQDPRAFRSVFIEHLERFYNTCLRGQNFACEVSGGLDSATLPQFLAQRGVRAFPISAQLYTNQFHTSQLQKLQEIAGRIQGQMLLEPITDHLDFPFNSLLDHTATPLFVRNPFAEVAERYAKRLQSQGVQVLATGHGGDDIFENVLPSAAMGYGEAERAARLTHEHPSFLTKRFTEEYIASTPTLARPLPLHSDGVLHTQAFNTQLIDYDIWPVSPFMSPHIYAFSQGLPVHYRANKNIMRAFHAAHDFAASIYNPTQNEHFGGIMLAAVRAGRYDKLIKKLLARSILLQLGYLDKQRFLDFYDYVRNDSDNLTAEDPEPLEIQRWLDIELGLQAIPHLKIAEGSFAAKNRS